MRDTKLDDSSCLCNGWQQGAAAWLLPLFDTYDYGWRCGRIRSIDQEDNNRIESALHGEVYLQRLTRKLLCSHLNRNDTLYYRSRRNSGRILLRVDIDAHNGEPDAPDLAAFLSRMWFNNCLYLESSPRGASGYSVLNVGNLSPAAINRAISIIASHFASTAKAAGYQATLELQGGITEIDWQTRTVIHRPKLARIPHLPGGIQSLISLAESPIVPIGRLLEACHLLEQCSEPPQPKPQRQAKPLDVDCAFARMRDVGCKLARELGRVPSVDELLSRYADVRGTPGNNARRQRALSVWKWLDKSFNPDKSREAGYEAKRDGLLELVRTHCKDRTHKCPTGISDEDLAITLFGVERVSFFVDDSPDTQWTFGHACLAGVFNQLREAGLTKRACSSRHKALACKQILTAAGLIECIDPEWLNAGPRDGISKKFTIATNHPRYGEFARFADGINVRYRPSKTQDADIKTLHCA